MTNPSGKSHHSAKSAKSKRPGGSAKPVRKGRDEKPRAGRSQTRRPTVQQSAGSPAKQPLVFTVAEPAELLSFLLTQLSSRGRNSVKSLLSRGQVSVNGVPVTRHNHPLQPGQTVAVSRDKIAETPELAGLTILHEDDDVIVVEKEAGLLSIAAADDNTVTAYRQLNEHVRASDPRARVFIVHRLDRDTSGVMMFAKNEAAQQQLQNTWKDSVKDRVYAAIVEGTVKRPEGEIRSWLKETATLKMYSSHHEGDGQLAVTRYKLLQQSRYYSLLDVRLETGRKNQIRVHMSDLGHPIAGDKKYGATSRTLGRLGLHARLLSFIHPTTGETLSFESPVPKAFLKATSPEPAKE